MNWTVYLSGEIHTDWRQKIMQGAEANRLPIRFTSAVTDHEAIIHPLKEVDAAAMAREQTPEQVVQILTYVTSGQ